MAKQVDAAFAAYRRHAAKLSGDARLAADDVVSTTISKIIAGDVEILGMGGPRAENVIGGYGTGTTMGGWGTGGDKSDGFGGWGTRGHKPGTVDIDDLSAMRSSETSARCPHCRKPIKMSLQTP